MVTFSPDHSAAVGLSIFSGFALATGLVLLAAGWWVYTVDTRWPSVVLGTLSVLAGLAGGIAQLRTVTMFFVIVVAWAAPDRTRRSDHRRSRAARRARSAENGCRPHRIARRPDRRHPDARTRPRPAAGADAVRAGVHDRGCRRDVHAHRHHHRRRDLRRLRRDHRGVPGDRRILAAQVGGRGASTSTPPRRRRARPRPGDPPPTTGARHDRRQAHPPRPDEARAAARARIRLRGVRRSGDARLDGVLPAAEPASRLRPLSNWPSSSPASRSSWSS